jgi:hypothetical protein
VEAVKQHRALEFASRELRRDRVAVEAVKPCSSLEFASRQLQHDRFAVEAVKPRSALEVASKEELQRDRRRSGGRQAAQRA